eukprot:UN22357
MIMSFSVYFICGCKNETKKFGNYRGHNNWFLAEGPPSNNSRRGGYATRGGPAQSNRGGSSSNRGQGGRGNRSRGGQRGGPRGNRSRGQPQYHPNRDSQQRYNNNSSPRYQSSTPYGGSSSPQPPRFSSSQQRTPSRPYSRDNQNNQGHKKDPTRYNSSYTQSPDGGASSHRSYPSGSQQSHQKKNYNSRSRSQYGNKNQSSRQQGNRGRRMVVDDTKFSQRAPDSFEREIDKLNETEVKGVALRREIEVIDKHSKAYSGLICVEGLKKGEWYLADDTKSKEKRKAHIKHARKVFGDKL